MADWASKTQSVEKMTRDCRLADWLAFARSQTILGDVLLVQDVEFSNDVSVWQKAYVISAMPRSCAENPGFVIFTTCSITRYFAYGNVDYIHRSYDI